MATKEEVVLMLMLVVSQMTISVEQKSLPIYVAVSSKVFKFHHKLVSESEAIANHQSGGFLFPCAVSGFPSSLGGSRFCVLLCDFDMRAGNFLRVLTPKWSR